MSTEEGRHFCVKRDECLKERTHVFIVEENMTKDGIRNKLWQVVPSLCGCLFSLVFGLMLGWPSPIYPKLLSISSPLPITVDQSAMIAGVLMAGFIVSTPFSTFSPLGTKYGILLTLVCMICGWLLMWQARSIYWLLGSRGLIGLSNGYGLGQIKQYIKDMCEPNLGKTLTKSINLFTIAGILIAVSVGPYVNFRQFSIMAACTGIVSLFICVFIPHTPTELVRFGKMTQASKLLAYLRTSVNSDIEMQNDTWSLYRVLCSQALRKNFVRLVVLIVFQQFTGPPSTIVYCQIMFAKLGSPCPDVFAIIYIVIFLCSNVLGYYYLEKNNKKYSLVFSSFTTSILLIINTILIYFKYNRQWSYSSAVVMCLFIFFHTAGLGCVPFNIIEKMFPKPALKAVTQTQIMLYSFFAIVVTKVFQVLMTNYDFYVPFLMFSCAAVSSTVFILIFIPNTLPELQVNTQQKKVICLL